MAVDPYRLPTLRRGVLNVLRIELRARSVLRQLRYANGWVVALFVMGLIAVAFRTWGFAISFGVILFVNVLVWAAWRRVHVLSKVAETDALSGWEFERWLEAFFEKLGFEVERTPFRGDFGADLIIAWNGTRTAVQAKSGHWNTGVSAVQQVSAARAYYRCERAMVVTNQYFTPEALVLAEANGVIMRSRDDLARKLRELT